MNCTPTAVPASPKARPTNAAVAPILAAALAVGLVPIAAQAQSAFPPLAGIVANGASITLSEPRISGEFEERIGGPYGLEGVVIVVDDCRPDPESYLDEALLEYGLAPAAGAMYDDAVAWLVCLEPRFTGFYYTADNPHAGALDSNAATEVMVQPLRDGNFTGAFTASIDVVAGQLALPSPGVARDLPPGVAPAATVGLSSGAASGAPSDTQDEAGTRGSAGGDAGQWLGLAAAAGLAGGAYLWQRRRRNSVAAETPTGKGALRDFDRRLERLGQRLTPTNQAVARIVLAYESMGDDAMLEVHRRHQAMIERLAELQRRGDQARSEALASDGTEDEIAAVLAEPRAELEELERYVDEIEAEAEHAEMLEERAPVLLVEAREAIAAAGAEYASGVSGRDLPDAASLLAVAVSLADAGEAALSAGRRLSAGRLAEGASHAAASVSGLPGEIRAADAAIDDVSVLFPRLEAYAEANWADVRGNGSEAEESLDAAAAMLARLASASAEAYGADTAAGFLASVARVRSEIERANRLVESIRQRLEFLDRAREQAADTIGQVSEELDRARSWLAQADVNPDVSPAPEEVLGQVDAMLGESRLAMNAPRPDWIELLRTVGRADRMVDEALADARAQQERVAAARRRLETARTDAAAAVDRCERYLSAHAADAGPDAPTRVGDARAGLAAAASAATRADSLEDTARLAALDDAAAAYGRARELADTSCEAMAASVARAEAARPKYQPRPDWMGPLVPTPRGPGPIIFGGWGGTRSRPSRGSQWGTRSTFGGGGGRSSSTRRGGGRGW